MEQVPFTIPHPKWEEETLRLSKEGLGVLSIATRLNVPWKKVAKYLQDKHEIPEGIYDLNGREYFPTMGLNE